MKTTVSIPGIHCNSCAAMIKDVSSEFSQIAKVDVDVAAKRVTLEHDASFDVAAWSHEIEGLGETYRVYPISK